MRDASLLAGELHILFTGVRSCYGSTGNRWSVITSLEHGSGRDISSILDDGVTAFVPGETIELLFPMLSSEVKLYLGTKTVIMALVK